MSFSVNPDDHRSLPIVVDVGGAPGRPAGVFFVRLVADGAGAERFMTAPEARVLASMLTACADIADARGRKDE